MADTRDAAAALPPAPNKKHLSPFAALDALKTPQKRRGRELRTLQGHADVVRAVA
jgi:hypothetical protein